MNDLTAATMRDAQDATLVKWWNEREGALYWLIALENELNHRGYATRDDEGKRTDAHKLEAVR